MYLGLRILVTSPRIRSFTLMRIRIRLLLRTKGMRICDYWSTNLQGLILSLHASVWASTASIWASKSSYILTLRRIRIQGRVRSVTVANTFIRRQDLVGSWKKNLKLDRILGHPSFKYGRGTYFCCTVWLFCTYGFKYSRFFDFRRRCSRDTTEPADLLFSVSPEHLSLHNH